MSVTLCLLLPKNLPILSLTVSPALQLNPICFRHQCWTNLVPWSWIFIEAAAHPNLRLPNSSDKHPQMLLFNIWQLPRLLPSLRRVLGPFLGFEMSSRVGRCRTNAFLVTNRMQKDSYHRANTVFEYFLASLHSFATSLSVHAHFSLLSSFLTPQVVSFSNDCYSFHHASLG